MKTFIVSLLLVAAPLLVSAESAVHGDGFTAHEWGTFTSVQGADGIQLVWNPFITSELPEFVYDRNRPTASGPRSRFALIASKSAFATLQRMETPVIYFYSDRQRVVDVTVHFPQGLITEWYPQVGRFGPFSTTNRQELELSRQSFLHWSEVEILPASPQEKTAVAFPSDTSGSHYFAARATDANPLRVPSRRGNSSTEQEKFLFYRGIGSFQAPLRVTMGGDEKYLQIANTGSEALSHLFVMMIRRGEGKFIAVDQLEPAEQRNLKLDPGRDMLPVSDLTTQLGGQLVAGLIAEGLYPREAHAMVDTWRNSWFEEEGLRVLYVLPRSWTDQILPLQIEPLPRDLVRVMVGRAEVITPSMEWELLRGIVHYSDANSAVRAQAADDIRQLGLGRFAEPALRRVLGHTPNREFSELGWNLVRQTSLPQPAKKALALR